MPPIRPIESATSIAPLTEGDERPKNDLRNSDQRAPQQQGLYRGKRQHSDQ